MIKNNYKQENKENGQSNFKAVTQMNDKDFLKHLGWTKNSD